LPEDNVDREQLRRRAGQYTLVNDELFWRIANDTLINASLQMNDALYCKTPTQGFVGVTWVLGLSWARHIGRGSFGPLLCLTPTP
jgi:hypothetical protein